MKKNLEGLTSGIPIFIGYFPAAAAFGILAKSCDISLFECVMFSAVVFAGASQFIALNMLTAGAGPLGIILTTFLVNSRHFLMSSYLSLRLKSMSRWLRCLVAFGVTDEVFSVLSFQKEKLSAVQVLVLEFSAYSGWVSGTIVGFLLGGMLPEVLTKSMAVALYSLLMAILLPEIRQSVRVLILAAGAGLMNTLLARTDLLPDGWSIVACILAVSFAGSFLPEMNRSGGQDG